MKKSITILTMVLLLNCAVQAQFKIGTPVGVPNASAILDASNTGGGNKGFLAPQVVLTGTATAAPVTSPANGLIVFNTSAGGSGATAVVVGYYYWNTALTQWVNFSTSASALTTGNIYTNDGTLAGPRTVTGSGLNKLNFNTKVGIGTTTPASALEIPLSTAISSITVDSGYIMLGQSANVHTLMDFANIQTKNNATSVGNLGLNPYGGSITMGALTTRTSLEVTGVVKLDSLASATATDSIVTVNAASGILHKRTISDLINNSGVATNIYNGDGSLTGTRTVNMDANTLNFTSTTGPININSTNNLAPLNVASNTNSISRTTFSNSNTGTSNRQDIAIVSNTKGIYFGVDNSSGIFGAGTKAYLDNRTNARLVFGNNGNENVTFDSIGRVGIGTSTPNAQLQFSATQANRKIVLYDGFAATTNDHQYYGFGINNNALRYQTDALASDHVFYAAASAATSNELMRIKGNGNVGIGINPSARLHLYEASGTVASPTAGTMILEHNNAGGASSILFKSKNNSGNDFGYIQYQDDSIAGGAGEKGKMIIGAQNDVAGIYEDDIALMASGNVGVNTLSPTAALDINGTVRIRTVAAATGTTLNSALVVDASGNVLKSTSASGSAAIQLSLVPAATLSAFTLPVVTNNVDNSWDITVTERDGCALSATYRFNLVSGNFGGSTFTSGGNMNGNLVTTQVSAATSGAVRSWTSTGLFGGCGDGNTGNADAFTMTLTYVVSGANTTAAVAIKNNQTAGSSGHTYYVSARQLF